MNKSVLCAARSFLFVPADRPDRFAKAKASAADVVIIDLEDAVAPEAKASARASLANWLENAAPGSACLRINEMGHPGHDEDLQLAAHPAIIGVMVPKVDSAACCQTVIEATGKPILALVETARGLTQLNEIATAGICRLVLGTIDLALDLDIDAASAEGSSMLDLARSTLRIASSAANLCSPVDGVHTILDDEAGLENTARHARAFGFGAMLAIHPSQANVINRTLAPTTSEIAWATRVVAAATDPEQRGAFRLDGRMIDAPIIEMARRTLLKTRL